MSCQQFISNLDGLDDGKDFPKEFLKVTQQTYTRFLVFYDTLPSKKKQKLWI